MNRPRIPENATIEPANSVAEWEGVIYDGTGSTYGSVPPAVLRATPSELLLSGSRGEYRLTRADIWKIGRGDFYPWLFCAIQIRHHVTDYPNELQFKPARSSPHAVLARLRALGYPVG